MQKLKISFFRLQTLKKALLFLKNFRKRGGNPPLTPPNPYKIIYCPPPSKSPSCASVSNQETSSIWTVKLTYGSTEAKFNLEALFVNILLSSVSVHQYLKNWATKFNSAPALQQFCFMKILNFLEEVHPVLENLCNFSWQSGSM